MDQNTIKSIWEIRRVSTPERIFQKITTEIPRPLGILVVGTEGSFKEEIAHQLADQINAVRLYVSRTSTHHDNAYRAAFTDGHNVLTMLTAHISAAHSERHRQVKAMYDAGAKSVIVVYVKGKFAYSHEDSYRVHRAVTSDPPTAEGVDYLITIREDEDEVED